MLTSAYVRIKNSAFTLNLWYLVTNTFPHLQRGTHSSISTSQVAIFFPFFAANCIFSRVCKFFGVVFCGCIGLNSYLGRKRLAFPPFLFILLLYNNRLTAISSENSRKITYRDPSIQFSYEMRDGWVKWINRTDGQKEDSNELYQYIKRLLTLQLQNIL